MAPLNLPYIDLKPYVTDPLSESAQNECKRAVEALKMYGAMVIKDPRVNNSDNEMFIDLMEDYFAQSDKEILKDSRPEFGYQVGATPEFTEEPKCKTDSHCLEIIKNLPEDQRPVDPMTHGRDPKARFFWRMGIIPKETRFPLQNMEPVIPERFKNKWTNMMNIWGNQLLSAIEIVSEMIAIGFDLPSDTFTQRGKYGAHLLAPTGTRLNLHGKLNTILAGFHTDISFLTIHGKSRYPGLNIWARNTGERISVAVPDGCLLVQSGKQLEHVTGGVIMAGFHEVVCTQATLNTMEKRKELFPTRPLIRVSSTLFYHMDTDVLLEPFPEITKILSSDEQIQINKKYSAILTGDQVQYELGLIDLMK